jgi:hypothetical protein
MQCVTLPLMIVDHSSIKGKDFELVGGEGGCRDVHDVLALCITTCKISIVWRPQRLKAKRNGVLSSIAGEEGRGMHGQHRYGEVAPLFSVENSQ